MKTLKIIPALILLALGAFAQTDPPATAFWRLASISGELRTEGFYRAQEIKRTYMTDSAQSYLISGGLRLNANSYFWHPNFLMVGLGLEYSPSQSRDRFLIIPDQGENRTLRKLDLNATLFQKKAISLTSFLGLSKTYNNREFLSDFSTDSRNTGAVLFFRNKLLPFSVSYQQGHIVQEEINTSRLFSYDNSILEGRINKSFGLRDKHELVYTNNQFKRAEREYAPLKNDLNELMMTNEISFDRHERYRFHSLLDGADQKGYDSLQRFRAFETVSFRLPAHFTLTGNYNYHYIDRRRQTINQQTYRGILRHKLFESLNSDAFYEHTDSRQTAFDQKDIRRGVDLAYEKKVPGGMLSLGYNYLLQHQEKSGDAQTLQIFRDEYVLTDGTIVRLKQPYADINSVVVRDVTGTVVYQLNFDYLLIDLGNNFIQIQRVPGGLIPNNGTVYIDYSAIMPGKYKYDMEYQGWSAGLCLFKQLVHVYYRNMKQVNFNLEKTEFLTLSHFTREIYGCRLEYKSWSGGIELDNYNSNIVPYKLVHYFASLQGRLRDRFMYSLNGNYSKYRLTDQGLDQEFADFQGQLVYSLTSCSKFNLDAGYRQQVGKGIDLNLLNARLEFTTICYSLHITLGVQAFNRNYMEEIDNFRGAYFRISRPF